MISDGYFASQRRSNPLTNLLGQWVEIVDPEHECAQLRGVVRSAYTNNDGASECSIDFGSGLVVTALAHQVKTVRELCGERGMQSINETTAKE